MTTKIKVMPIGIGALSGLALVFIGAKAMKKKASGKHYIIGAILGAGAGFLISNMGEKKSNVLGAGSGTYKYVRPQKGWCKQAIHGGGSTTYNVYEHGGSNYASNPC